MRDYGHHSGIYADVLTRVPWLVIEDGSRRRIRAQEPTTDEEVDTARVEERLADLGYAI